MHALQLLSSISGTPGRSEPFAFACLRVRIFSREIVSNCLRNLGAQHQFEGRPNLALQIQSPCFRRLCHLTPGTARRWRRKRPPQAICSGARDAGQSNDLHQ
eukprot:1493369-Rhodomonas_salina.1